MCGITGFFSYKNKIEPKKYYEAHLKIAHRGPDDEGFIYKNENNQIEYLKGNDTIDKYQNREHITNKSPSPLILGHRRLSIIDLTSHGHQPFVFENLYLVYNGEIYNYIELRDELKKLGYIFETETDTEVFLKAFHCWGVEAFNKFNGMWAAAIYDSKKDEILLTRDRFGIKPLYYSLINDSLIFGSEIKFIASFFRKLEANEQMVYDYVEYGYISHTNETIFKDISQVEAGCYAIYDLNSFSFKRYYFKEKKQIIDSIQSVKKALLDSIKLRMRSDVKVGSLLSGGMDSSSIVCAIYKEKYTTNMDTFTISYAEKELDYEAKYVNDINKQTNFKNHSIHLDPDSEILDKLTYIIETPYRSFTETAMFKIYDYISSHTDIRVLLNGEGSDEIFSGYNAHYSYYLYTLLTQAKFIRFLREFKCIQNRTKRKKLSLLIDIVKAFVFHNNLHKYIKKSKIFKKKYIDDRPKKSKNPFRNEILINREFSALPEYLKYADKIPMYFSLEIRVPFLDYRLVNIAHNLQDDELIKNGITKYTLREAVKDIVPKSVYEREDKKGFFTPHELWLKTKLSKSIQNEMEKIKEEGLFSFMDSSEIYNYYIKKGSQDQKVWRIYCLSRWKKVWGVVG